MDLGLLLLIGGALGGFSGLIKDGFDSGDNTGSRGNSGNTRDNQRSSRDGNSSSRTGDLELGKLERGDLSLNRDGDSSNDIVSNDIATLLDSFGVDTGSLTGSSSGYLDYHNNTGQPSFKSIWDALSGLISAYSGYDLTNAQRGEMAFNHDEAVLQRQYEMQMSNTAYQRAVSDMTSAGINPALMYGRGAAGASTPSGASASAAVGGVSSDLLSKLFDMVMNKRSLHMQDLMSKRQSDTSVEIAKINADKDIKIAEMKDKTERRGQDFNYDISNRTLENNIKAVEAQVKLWEEQASTEESKRAANNAASVFSLANADNVRAMRPYLQNYYNAMSDEARAIAQYNLVEAGFKNSLISNGLVHYVMEEYRLGHDEQQVRKELLDIAARRIKVNDDKFSRSIGYISNIMLMLKNCYLVDPGSIFGVNFGSNQSQVIPPASSHRPISGFRP